MKMIGYARVSTVEQGVHGTSLEEQRRQLLDYGCDEVYQDIVSGATDAARRPGLMAAIGALPVFGGGVLVVVRLDRLARSTRAALSVADTLISYGHALHVCDIGRIDDTSTGRLMLTMLSAMAEFERALIIERTRAGKAAARLKPGFRDGRPPVYDENFRVQAVNLARDYGVSVAARRMGCSRGIIYVWLKQADIL